MKANSYMRLDKEATDLMKTLYAFVDALWGETGNETAVMTRQEARRRVRSYVVVQCIKEHPLHNPDHIERASIATSDELARKQVQRNLEENHATG